MHDYATNNFLAAENFDEITQYIDKYQGKLKFVLPSDFERYKDANRSLEDNMSDLIKNLKTFLKELSRRYKELYQMEAISAVLRNPDEEYSDEYEYGYDDYELDEERINRVNRGYVIFSNKELEDFKKVTITVSKSKKEYQEDKIKAAELKNLNVIDKLIVILTSDIDIPESIDGLLITDEIIRTAQNNLRNIIRVDPVNRFPIHIREILEYTINFRENEIKKLLNPNKTIRDYPPIERKGDLIDFNEQFAIILSYLKEKLNEALRLRYLSSRSPSKAYEEYKELGIEIQLIMKDISEFVEDTLGYTEETEELIEWIQEYDNYFFSLIEMSYLDTSVSFEYLIDNKKVS